MNPGLLQAVGIGLALSLAAGAAQAASVGGVSFPEAVEAGGERLEPRGAGILRVYGIVRAYAACFYLPRTVSSGQALGEVPRRLEIEYFHPISAADFTRATEAGVARNASLTGLERLRPAIRALNALYRDVRPGDRYALTYVPGEGTTLELNGVPLGTVPGAEFSAALFAIWLGENPLDARLKAALLGEP